MSSSNTKLSRCAADSYFDGLPDREIYFDCNVMAQPEMQKFEKPRCSVCFKTSFLAILSPCLRDLS